MIKSEAAVIDFSKNFESVANFINGLNVSPVAYFYLDKKRYNVYESESLSYKEFLLQFPNYASAVADKKPGEILVCDKSSGFFINAGGGVVEIKSLQKEGGKRLAVKDFLNGSRLTAGSVVNNE